MDEIMTLSLDRIRAFHDVPSLGDDVLVFNDLKLLPQVQEGRRLNCLIIGLCTSGEGGYVLDMKEHHIGPNEVIILTEGQVVNRIWMSKDCEGWACIISYEFFYEILRGINNLSELFMLARNHPVFKMLPKEVETAKTYLTMVYERLAGEDYTYRKDVIRLLLLTMLYDLGSAFYRVMSNTDFDSSSLKADTIFVRFITLLERNFMKERRVAWYAQQLGISPKYLSELVSGTSKRSPNDWIDKYVTTEIRNQLHNTDKKISQIAIDMHFPNQSFLGKYFRQNVGMSPTEYRKRMINT